jgi:hypothetical protein
MEGRMQLSSAVRSVAVVMSLAWVATGCEEPPPAPPVVLTEATRAQVLAYAQGLTFDARRAASTACGELTFGYEPVNGLGRITPADIRAGRIIGRISLNVPAMRLGLAAGVTYVWIDSIAGPRWRLGVLPTEPLQPVRFLELDRECHGGDEFSPLNSESAILSCPPPEATLNEWDAWFDCDEDGQQCCCCMGPGPCSPDTLMVRMRRASVTPLRDTINFLTAFTTTSPPRRTANR